MKIATKPLQLQSDVRLRAEAEWSLPQEIADDDGFLSDERRDDASFSTENISDDKETSSAEQERGALFPPQLVSNTDESMSHKRAGDEQILWQYGASYSQICLLQDTKDITSLIEKIRKVRISVGFMANTMHYVKSVFRTATGQNIIREDLLYE